MTDLPPTSAPRRDLASAILLGAGALLSVLAMADHPTARGHGGAELIAGLNRIAGFNALVHGVLILLTGAMTVGAFGFSDSLTRPRLARAGRLAWLAGALALSIAGLINGFATTGFAKLAGTTPAALTAAHAVLAGFWALNQAFAAAGVVAVSTAALLWSVDLVRQSGLARLLGVTGGLAAAVALVAMLTGRLTLDVHGFGLFVLGQSLWGLGAAALLLFRKPGG